MSRVEAEEPDEWINWRNNLKIDRMVEEFPSGVMISRQQGDPLRPVMCPRQPARPLLLTAGESDQDSQPSQPSRSNQQ